MIARRDFRQALLRISRRDLPPLPAPAVRFEALRAVLLPPAPAPASAWDPEPTPASAQLAIRAALELDDTLPLDEEQRIQEAIGSKTLLLEIIRRAAYDWVLYRTHHRIQQRILAEQAFQWLFVEVPGSTDWNTRLSEGKYITGFVAICEALDLDPEMVRRHIRNLTAKNVLSVGRPAEYRRRDPARMG